jgi:hypothetical protein
MPTYDDPDSFRAALRAAQRAARKASRKPPPVRLPGEKAKLPRRLSERTGLAALVCRGWRAEYDVASQTMRLTRGAVDTGWCPDERAACDAAKRLEARQDDRSTTTVD